MTGKELEAFAGIAVAAFIGGAFIAGMIHDEKNTDPDPITRLLIKTPWLSHGAVAVLAAAMCYWWDSRPNTEFEDCVLKHVKAGMSDDVAAAMIKVCELKSAAGKR